MNEPKKDIDVILENIGLFIIVATVFFLIGLWSGSSKHADQTSRVISLISEHCQEEIKDVSADLAESDAEQSERLNAAR